MVLWVKFRSSSDIIKYQALVAISHLTNRTERMRRFLQDVLFHYELQDFHDMLIQSCVKRGHTSHAIDKSCAILQSACLQAIESIAGSPNEVVKELSNLLDTPGGSVLFDEHRLDCIFQLLFELWIGIETHIPEFRVPDTVSLYGLSSYRREALKNLLYVILI